MTRRETVLLVASAACAAAVGCGLGDKPVLPPVLPPDLQVGSTEDGAGDLNVVYDFANVPAPLSESAVVGSLVLYTSIEPAFDGVVEADPDLSLYPFAAEIPLIMELVAVDSGAAVRIGGVTLENPGDQAEIVVGPGTHLHPEWQLIAPVDVVPEPHRLSFRLVDPSGTFGATETYELTLEVVEGS